MRMRNFLLAAAAAILGFGHAAVAQYGPMGGPAGAYPDMMAAGGMGMGMGGPGGMGMGGPGGFPGQSPYAPQAFAPASYAGMGGPAPMGPGPMGGGPMGPSVMAPSMSPMGPMGPMGQPQSMAPMAMDGGSGMGGPMQGGSSFAGLMDGGGDYCADCGPGGGGWTNRYFAWGEFLYLRPRNAEVAFAVPVNAAAAAGTPGAFVQTGNVAVVEHDYQPAFRAGFGFLLSPRSAIAVSYSQFDRLTNNLASVPFGGTDVLAPLVISPNTPATTATAARQLAGAELQTQFRILDIDYRGLLVYNPQWQLNYVIGARYGNLEQHFAAQFAPLAGGIENVRAESEFDGGGLKLGLETLRFHPTTQFFFYGKGYTSFLAGQFRERYQYDPVAGVPTTANFNVGRLVTMFDLEAGLGWQNYTGNFRLSAGYMFQSWLNTIRVADYINSVQANNFITQPASNVNGMVTFDGLVTKIELLW